MKDEQKLREIERKYGGFENFELITLCNEKDKYITDLQSQLAITEKALELACDYLVSNGNEDDELYKLVQNIYADDEYLATKINYFKTKAKEMMKSE